MERNEAIELLRRFYSDASVEKKAALECLIPELKESEDEKIRKALNDEIKVWDEDYKLFKHVSKEKVLAYLEKRKEPLTPTESYMKGFSDGVEAQKEVEQKPLSSRSSRKRPAELAASTKTTARLSGVNLFHIPTRFAMNTLIPR